MAKKLAVVLVILMAVILAGPATAAEEDDWLWKADVEYLGLGNSLAITSPAAGSGTNQTGTNAYYTDLLELQTGAPGGILTRIAANCISSDAWTIYLYNQDIDNWSTNPDRLKETITIWTYDSTTTGRIDTDLYSYSVDNGAIYIGYYNDDDSYSSNCEMHLEGEKWNRADLGTFSSD